MTPANPVRWLTAVLDTPEATAAAAEGFWAAITGTTPSARPSARGSTLVPATGDPCLRVQRTGDDAVVHLELHVDDPDATADDAMGRGAEPVADPGGDRVLRSPGGFAFHLVSWKGEATPPAAGPGGAADQICLDMLPGTADAEIAFWAGFTGWAPRGIDRPEYTFLDRPSGMPLRILLQRLDRADGTTGATAAGAHLDVGCTDPDDPDDPAATLARHVDLGAVVVARHPWWTVLRDPAGRPYCLVRRGG